MYAIIDVILGGTDLTFLPEEVSYDGFVTFDCVISADAADALAQGAMLGRTGIELCAEPYLRHARR